MRVEMLVEMKSHPLTKMAENLETTSNRKDIVTIIVTILVRTPIDLQSSSAAMGCPGCPARYQKMYRDLLAQGARRVVVRATSWRRGPSWQKLR